MQPKAARRDREDARTHGAPCMMSKSTIALYIFTSIVIIDIFILLSSGFLDILHKPTVSYTSNQNHWFGYLLIILQAISVVALMVHFFT